MVTNLTLGNLDSVKVMHRFVSFRGERQVYILATGPKNTAMFVPLQHGIDYRYKCKNVKSAIKAAVTNGENVIVTDTAEELFRHYVL